MASNNHWRLLFRRYSCRLFLSKLAAQWSPGRLLKACILDTLFPECLLIQGPGLRPLRRSRRVNHSAISTYDKQVTPVLDNANPQLGSAFFTRLPAEIRRLIYSFAAPSQVVHVLRGLPLLYEGLVAWGCHCKQGNVCDSQTKFAICRSTSGMVAVLGLPLACRLIHAESIPILYRQLCFLFIELRTWKIFCDSLLKFQAFTHGALQSLRSVQIDFRVLGWRTFTAEDEAMLRASLEMLMQRAAGLENLYIYIAPRSPNSAKLQPVTLNLFRALSKLRGLKEFEFSVQHPLNRIPMEQLSLQGARQRREFEEKVLSLKQALDNWVHQPRGVQTAGGDRALSKEFGRIMAIRWSEA